MAIKYEVQVDLFLTTTQSRVPRCCNSKMHEYVDCHLQHRTLKSYIDLEHFV